MISQHFLRVCQRAGLDEAQKLLEVRPDLKISPEEENPIKNLWNSLVTAMDMRNFADEVRKELSRPTVKFTIAGAEGKGEKKLEATVAGVEEKGEKKLKRDLSKERDIAGAEEKGEKKLKRDLSKERDS